LSIGSFAFYDIYFLRMCNVFVFRFMYFCFLSLFLFKKDVSK
jgi:hypothetical protein